MTDFGHLGAQKELERKHLVAFRRVCTDFPFGRIVSGETPDFVVHRASTKIGIEHTQVYIDDAKKRSSLQSREAAKIKITRLAEKQAQEAGLPNIYVNLFFNRTWSPDPKQDDRIARAVAQTVINNIPPEDKSVWVSYRLHSVQPIEVDLISIHRISDFGDERWSCQTEAGEPLKDAVTRIQAAIDSKAGRFQACLQKCEACWLLIVAPSWSPSGMVHPDEASLEHAYTSPFTRTHFFNLSYGTAVPLKTEPAAV